MRFPLLAAVTAALVLQGCGPEAVGPLSGETARLRLASASPDAGTLDLLVNGRTVAQAVGRTEVSQAAVLEPGSASGEIRATGTSAALASLPLALEAGKSYTVLVAGPVHALTAMVSVDTGSAGAPPPPPCRNPAAGGQRQPAATAAGGFRQVQDPARGAARAAARSLSRCRPARRWIRSPHCSHSRTAAWRSPPTWSGGRAIGRSSLPRRGPRGSC